MAVDWEAATPLKKSYASFAHLVDENGKMLAGDDEPDTGASRPTTAWSPGQQIIDNLAIRVPRDTAPGRYRLVVGMYSNDAGKLSALAPACADSADLYDGSIGPGWVGVTGS